MLRREFVGVLLGAAVATTLPPAVIRRAYQRYGAAESTESRIQAAIAQAVRENQASIWVPQALIPYAPRTVLASSVRLVP